MATEIHPHRGSHVPQQKEGRKWNRDDRPAKNPLAVAEVWGSDADAEPTEYAEKKVWSLEEKPRCVQPKIEHLMRQPRVGADHE